MSLLNKAFGAKEKQETPINNEKSGKQFDETQSNIVKVFVSSTFKDLEEERSCLATKVFPRLRSFCYKKGLAFQDLDLRWGITEEESQNGQVVRLCLKGIDESVPYFICILGDRYGWIPSENDINLGDEQIYKDFVKVQVDKERSITEIEIRYALLHKESIKPFFFFKSSSDISNPDGKMALLKDEIKHNFPESVFFFSTSEELLNKVYDILTKDIEGKYPSSITDSVLQEEILQDTNTWKRLSESMLKLSSFDKCYTQLDRVLADNIHLLWLTSDNDTSHRYIVADWIKNHENGHKIFYFDCENAVSKIDSYNILWKIYQRVCLINLMTERLKYNSMENEMYSPIQELTLELERISNDIEVKPLFVIDNIDNCSDFSYRFVQTIEKLSSKLGFVLLSSNAFYEKQGRISIFTHHHIPTWSSDEAAVYIDKYLNQYGKKINKIDCEKLVNNMVFKDMFMLKLALDTLRQYATYDDFSSVIDNICSANSKVDLYSKVLSYIKHNYSNKEEFISRFLWLIVESQIGLTINDLQILTNATPLTIYEITDVLSSFISTQGNRLFVNDMLFVQAIKDVFPITDEQVSSFEKALISYFEKEKEIPDEKIAVYVLSELYIKTEDWDKLFNLLTNPTYFYYYINNAQDLFYARWEIIKNQSSSDGNKFSFPIYHIEHSDLDRKNAESLAWSYLTIFQTSQKYFDDEHLLSYLDEAKKIIADFKLGNTYLESVLFAFYAKYFIKQNNLKDALAVAVNSYNIRRAIYHEENEFVIKAKQLLFQIYNQSGNIIEAKKLISEFETLISSNKQISAQERINILELLIDYYKINTDYKKILAYSNNLLETIERYYTKDSYDYIMTIYNYCVNLADINEPKDSYLILNDVVNSDYFIELQNSIIKVAITFYYLKVRVLLKQDFDLKKELSSLQNECPNDIECKEYILSNGAPLLLEAGFYELALDWANREIEFCQSNHLNELGSAFERKGGILHYMNKPKAALEELLKAEAEYLKSSSIESLSNLANLYSSIGACYAQMSDNRCVQYMQKSIVVAEDNFGKEGTSLALRYKNLGIAYFLICKEFKNAVLAFSQAANLYKGSNFHEELLDTYQWLLKACLNTGLLRKAIDVISHLPQNQENQNLANNVMNDILKCANCIDVIKEFRHYGTTNYNAMATIRLLTSEFFLACYQEGLCPIIDGSGYVYVYYEGRVYHYTPSEEFCDTVIIRSKLNKEGVSEKELSEFNGSLIRKILLNEKTDHEETFHVVAQKEGYALLSTLRSGEMSTFRGDCINILNISAKIIRNFEEL